MDKLSIPISTHEVCVNGSRALHGVWKGVEYWEDGRQLLKLDSLDAPLVAPGNATLLVFDNVQPAATGGMHFNLVRVQNRVSLTPSFSHRPTTSGTQSAVAASSR